MKNLGLFNWQLAITHDLHHSHTLVLFVALVQAELPIQIFSQKTKKSPTAAYLKKYSWVVKHPLQFYTRVDGCRTMYAHKKKFNILHGDTFLDH